MTEEKPLDLAKIQGKFSSLNSDCVEQDNDLRTVLRKKRIFQSIFSEEVPLGQKR